VGNDQQNGDGLGLGKAREHGVTHNETKDYEELRSVFFISDLPFHQMASYISFFFPSTFCYNGVFCQSGISYFCARDYWKGKLCMW